MHDIEDALCAAVGLADHQRLSAVHNDTDHFHFHIAIIKVHPDSSKLVTPWQDAPKLAAACQTLERRHGLTRTNHAMPERGADRPNDRAETMEQRSRQQSLLHWVRDEAGPALLKAQETGGGWQDLHRAAATYGLEIKPRGAGLVIAVAGDKYARVKPSDIDRQLTFGALTAKWGAYQAPTRHQAPPQHVYPRAPLHKGSSQAPGLFREYQRDRERALADRKTDRDTRRAVSDAYRKELAEWAPERRRSIKDMPYTGEGRRAAYADLKRTRDLAMERETARLAEERAQARKRPVPTWQSWLQTQAAQGNAPAVAVLRSMDQRKAELGAAVLTAANADQARHVVYQHLRPSVGRDGSITYRVADGGRVTDQAQQVRVDEVTTASTFLALSLAVDRFGNRPLVVDGADAFKRELAKVAGIEGMRVTFADPTMEAERQRHVDQRRHPHAMPQPEDRAEVRAFVAGRNAARERVTAIQPHRAWTLADTGEAVYGGHQQLAEGLEAVLLHKDGQTLVKVVTPAQAAEAAAWSVGDAVRADDRGGLHDHRPAEQQEEEQDKGQDLGR